MPFSCGGTLNAQVFSQTFSSPKPYPAGGECVWKIEAPEGQLISLTVDDFDTKLNKDQLIIYNGNHPSAAVLARLTGTVKNQLIVSTTNHLYIYFFSNYASNAKGFTISYKRGCKNTIKYTHGSILSPGYGHIPYPLSKKCEYTIDLPEPMASLPISMSLNELDIQNEDKFVIHEGSENGVVLYNGQNAGDLKNPKQIHSKNGKVVITFDSGAMKNGQGWNLTFSTSKNIFFVY